MNDAQQAPIVRSHQKDAHFRAHLRSLLREFADSLPGLYWPLEHLFVVKELLQLRF